jgi:hypothetical protein
MRPPVAVHREHMSTEAARLGTQPSRNPKLTGTLPPAEGRDKENRAPEIVDSSPEKRPVDGVSGAHFRCPPTRQAADGGEPGRPPALRYPHNPLPHPARCANRWVRCPASPVRMRQRAPPRDGARLRTPGDLHRCPGPGRVRLLRSIRFSRTPSSGSKRRRRGPASTSGWSGCSRSSAPAPAKRRLLRLLLRDRTTVLLATLSRQPARERFK